MPAPKQLLALPPQISPHIRELFDKLVIVANDHRTSQLVDYLCDLFHEMQWVTEELAELDFDAVAFLEMFASNDAYDRSDGDDDDAGFEDVGAD